MPVWYVVGKNEGHGFAKKANQDYLQAVEIEFLRRYLLGGDNAEPPKLGNRFPVSGTVRVNRGSRSRRGRSRSIPLSREVMRPPGRSVMAPSPLDDHRRR